MFGINKPPSPATSIHTERNFLWGKEALAGAANTQFTVKGVVTLVDGKNIYIQDETGGIDLYFNTAPTGISLGDTLIGTGKRATYKGLPELSGATYEMSEGMTLTATERTIGTLTDADICTYVSLKGLKVTAVDDNGGAFTQPNITVVDPDDSTKTIQIYNAVRFNFLFVESTFY